eukprot:4417146-Pyramimonas_sp.AAC.1
MAAHLQSGNIERRLVKRTPANNPPLETQPGEIAMATGDLRGARRREAAARQRYLYAQKVFAEHGL